MSAQLEQVKLQGYRSFALGIPVNSNWHLPWPQSREFTAWLDGWNLGFKDSQKIKLKE